MTPHKHPPSKEEALFHRAIVDVLSSHSRLDHNMGLSIIHLQSPKNPRESYSKIGKLSFTGKLEKLESILKDQELKSSYQQWLNRNSRYRALRNNFAHARWT